MSGIQPKENLYANAIRTHSGIYMDVFAPTVDMIDINDIAHALSNMCRFGGHLDRFYSVAQHSVMVSRYCPIDVALQGLLHDAAEAYMLDMPSPIKKGLRNYKSVEIRLLKVIAKKFNFPFPMSGHVKIADQERLEWEWKHMVLREPIPVGYRGSVWKREKAKERFLAEFRKLTRSN